MSDPSLFSLENQEWKIFLAKFYMCAKQRNPHVDLEHVYPIAQRKYIMNKKTTGLHLNLMANPKKLLNSKK